MKNFPYLVREEYAKLNDGRCCYEMPDRTGFHRCNKKAKKYIDGVGFCGTHARSVERWRKVIDEVNHLAHRRNVVKGNKNV